MRVKNILFIFATLLALFPLTPRNAAQNIGFGLQGGIDITSVTGGAVGVGIHIGSVAEIPLYGDRLTFEPAINIGLKTAGRDFLSTRQTYRVGMVNLPLLFAYHIPLTPEVVISPLLGPTVGLGLFGSLNTKDGSNSNGKDLFSELEYQRWTYGVSFGGYIRLRQHFQVGVTYDCPLADFRKSFISADHAAHTVIRLSNMKITVSYLF